VHKHTRNWTNPGPEVNKLHRYTDLFFCCNWLRTRFWVIVDLSTAWISGADSYSADMAKAVQLF